MLRRRFLGKVRDSRTLPNDLLAPLDQLPAHGALLRILPYILGESALQCPLHPPLEDSHSHLLGSSRSTAEVEEVHGLWANDRNDVDLHSIEDLPSPACQAPEARGRSHVSNAEEGVFPHWPDG